MEQTLGKRIAANRKRLGLTQDQLAEKLGITAQAISKWENDQSCPDITMLPRLAEIFGTSTDALLGMEKQNIVYEAEVVEEDAQEPEGLHIHNGKWEFHLDSGKKAGVAFAVFVLWVGALTLLSKILKWDVTFWGILWPSSLLIFGLAGLFRRFSVFHLGCGLFGGYFLISNLGIWELNIAGELIFPICVILLGMGLLLDALRKPKKPLFKITHNDSDKIKSHHTTHNDRFECELAFGENTHYIDLPLLAGGDIHVSFGELTVDMTGCEAVSDHCVIDANCSFGELCLKIPKRFRVEHAADTAFAAVNITGYPDPTPAGTIYLDADVSFGEIEVHYV